MLVFSVGFMFNKLSFSNKEEIINSINKAVAGLPL